MGTLDRKHPDFDGNEIASRTSLGYCPVAVVRFYIQDPQGKSEALRASAGAWQGWGAVGTSFISWDHEPKVPDV